ncbi:MAG: hypothetical protein ACOX17_07620 [Christensenellales bacterium]
MKTGTYLTRLGWFLLKLLAAIGLLAGLLTAVFQIAMHTANVYVVVTDGMKMRATAIMTPEDMPANVELGMYFSQDCMTQDTLLQGMAYDNCDISSFSYHLKVEEIACRPWKGIAHIVLTETVPSITGTAVSGLWDENGEVIPGEIPAWPHARYRIDCRLTDESWIITGITTVLEMAPEPTPTKEPDVTALPATPTVAPTPTPEATPARTLPPWPQEDIP